MSFKSLSSGQCVLVKQPHNKRFSVHILNVLCEADATDVYFTYINYVFFLKRRIRGCRSIVFLSVFKVEKGRSDRKRRLFLRKSL